MSDTENGEEVKLSPQDVEKLKRCMQLTVQAKGILEDMEDIREEYGDLEDALTKLGEAEDLLEETIPEDEGDGGSADPPAA